MLEGLATGLSEFSCCFFVTFKEDQVHQQHTIMITDLSACQASNLHLAHCMATWLSKSLDLLEGQTCLGKHQLPPLALFTKPGNHLIKTAKHAPFWLCACYVSNKTSLSPGNACCCYLHACRLQTLTCQLLLDSQGNHKLSLRALVLSHIDRFKILGTIGTRHDC